MLRPGTHHVRFLVDDQWRVADDIPAAVDDQGSLANYVAVPIPVSSPSVPPPATIPREKLLPGQSFWSADSSADGEYQPSPQQQQQQTLSHTTHSYSGRWTNILPPELIEAALEEETYLAASAGHYDGSSSTTRVTTGFIPAPNIPPAPGLPRHLEKLILNTRVGPGSLGVSGTGSAAAAATRSGSGQARGVGPMGVGSGQGQHARNRDRDRDRDRERDRERERGERGMRKRATTAAASAAGSVPPPPPPSEDGSVPPDSRVPVTLPETSSVPSTDTSSTTPSSTSAPAISTNTKNPPQTPLPSTPIAPMSPIWSKDLGKTCGGGNENGNGTETSPTMSPTRSPTTMHSSISTSTSANVSATTSATASPNLSTNPTTAAATPPYASLPSSHFSPSASSHSTPTGSRTITIDNTNMPTLSDDGSVLPVPSHVVLHHLSTSAIRNGVLAVGNTIRYRKKVSFLSSYSLNQFTILTDLFFSLFFCSI